MNTSQLKNLLYSFFLLALLANAITAQTAACSKVCKTTTPNVCTGNVKVVNADDLACFQNITSIAGVFTIAIANASAEFNLDSLSNLQSTAGLLSIRNNPNLVSISGLSSLLVIGGLDIGLNPKLQSFGNAFAALTNITASANITDNAMLADISGSFGSLLRINLDFALTNNPLLSALSFPALKIIGRQLTITNNPALVNLDAFPALTNVVTVIIDRNANLQSITSFDNVQAISKSFYLTDLNVAINPQTSNFIVSRNPSLKTFSAFANTATLGNFFNVYNNSNLETLTAFRTLQKVVTNSFVQLNPKLQSIDLLEFCNKLTGYVEIRGNSQLNTIVNFLPNLLTTQGNIVLTDENFAERIAGSVVFKENPSLLHLVMNLVSINGYLRIKNTPFITVSFPTLTTVNGEVLVQNNSALRSVDIDGVTAIGSRLIFRDNSQLLAFPHLNNASANLPVPAFRLGGNFEFVGNALVQSLSVLDGLAQINGVIIIQSNAQLNSITGFTALRNVTGGILISDNPVLTLISIPSIVQINKNFVITGSFIKTLNPNGGYVISNNPLLESAYVGARVIMGNYNIYNTTNLIDSPVLSASIQGEFKIYDNDKLTGLTAAVSQEYIRGDLQIFDNPMLQSITNILPINALGVVRVYNNPSLLSIMEPRRALGALPVQTFAKNLEIYGNNRLTQIVLADASSLKIGSNLRVHNNSALIKVAIPPTTVNGSSVVNGGVIKTPETFVCNLDPRGGLALKTADCATGNLLIARLCACSLVSLSLQAISQTTIQNTTIPLLSAAANVAIGSLSTPAALSIFTVTPFNTSTLKGQAAVELNNGLIVSVVVRLTSSNPLQRYGLALLAFVSASPLELVQLNSNGDGWIPVSDCSIVGQIINILDRPAGLTSGVLVGPGIFAIRLKVTV